MGAAILRRHDLLRVEPAAWRDMLRRHPAIADLPLVEDWALRAWPVIARRRLECDGVASVAAALPLPPCHGKRRIGFNFRSRADVTLLPPVLLCDAARCAPAAWQPTISALIDLGASVGAPPRVFGALLWQHATGLPYLTDQSDIDLLWSPADEAAAASLVAGLWRLDSASPVRLDGELELLDGGGVNWREIASETGIPNDVALVKTIVGVEMRKVDALFCARGAEA